MKKMSLKIVFLVIPLFILVTNCKAQQTATVSIEKGQNNNITIEQNNTEDTSQNAVIKLRYSENNSLHLKQDAKGRKMSSNVGLNRFLSATYSLSIVLGALGSTIIIWFKVFRKKKKK